MDRVEALGGLSVGAGGTEPEVAVVIPCRDHTDELEDCLASLDRLDPAPPHEILVVDAGNGQGLESVAAGHARVELVRGEGPLGPGAARNLGVAASRAPKLAFLDADCTADPGWLTALCEALDTGAAAVGGPVTNALPFHPIAVTDNLLQFYDLPAARRSGELDYFPACNLALSRARFETLGGFPDLGLGEDVQLTRAAAALEGGLRFAPDMRVRHRGRTGFTDFLAHHRRFGFYRGSTALFARPLERRFSHRALWAPFGAMRRLAYIAARSARHRPLALLHLLLLLPLVVPGLGAWALGVVEGSRERQLAEANRAPRRAGA